MHNTTLLAMGRALALSLGLLALETCSAEAAEPLTVAQARAVVTPFYDALNAGRDEEVASLVMQATSPEWTSCGGAACLPRDKAIGGIVRLHKAVPDLKWEIKEVLVAGDRVIVRGEASGTPVAEFMGVPSAGKSFHTMSIDVHTIAGGRLVLTYHVEDWMSAARQLAK